MRPLVAVRRARAFDPDFVERDALFSTIEPAYRRIRAHADVDFPDTPALHGVFSGDAPVRFERSGAKRRRGAAVDVGALYDARIALEGVVPTRPRCWHDFMNALVWGTFPRSKGALHRRQHRAIAERVAPGARTLPPRTPELDALALIDEGGVIVLAEDRERASSGLTSRRAGALRALLEEGCARVLVFGHAVYESLALGARPAVVAAFVAQSADATHPVESADRQLAAALEDPSRFRTPRELVRVDLEETRP